MIAIVEGDRTTYSGALTAGQWYTVAALGAGGEMGGLATPVQAPSGSIGVSDLPSVLAIGSISPNPFNPSTRIAFDLPARSHVELAIYDMRGRLVKGLIGGTMEAGRHEIDWNGRDDDGRQQSAGVYLMRLDAGGETRTAKMVMAK